LKPRLFFWTAVVSLVVCGAAGALYFGSQSVKVTSQAEPVETSAQRLGQTSQNGPAKPPPHDVTPTSAAQILASGERQKDNAETRLIKVFSLIETGDFREALHQAENLTRDHPNFNLAHLVHGDLLKLRYEPQATTGGAENAPTQATLTRLAALQTETRARLTALRDRPPTGHIPQQFLALSPVTKHAIAVDASRSRLYLFENTPLADSASSGPAVQPPNLKLIGDFFISVGKAGIDKRLEGDGKTPLGAYYITSVRDKKTLPEFYGAGALPLNYPNVLDVQQGRTGSGIWLHGSPPQQYVRAPLASDGCVVLSNPDMDRLLALVAPRTTPVVIAEKLEWAPASAVQTDTTAFASVLTHWLTERNKAAQPSQAAPAGITQVSLLKWQDAQTHVVATFEETADGQATGLTRRQYWSLQPQGWRLSQDTVLSAPSQTAVKRSATKKSADALTARRDATSQTKNSKNEDDTPQKMAATPTAPAQQVQLAVQAWAKAWSQKNMAQYLAAYAPSFAPPGGLSRKAWEQERRDRIVSKNKISVHLSKLTIHTNGNTATVGFVQNYKADQLAVASHKTLKLVRRGDQWLITQESVGGR
jgi:L,D-transpeptidase YnhG